MYYAFEGGVSTENGEGRIAIDLAQYLAGIEAITSGQEITIDGGFRVRNKRPSENHHWDGTEWVYEPPEEPAPVDDLPPPAVLVMSTANVHIDGEDVNVTGGGFNFGGAMRDGPGLYALFTLIPLSGTAFDPWFSVGGGFTLKATVVDPYLVTVEATDINGNPADPEFFSMRIYQP